MTCSLSNEAVLLVFCANHRDVGKTVCKRGSGQFIAKKIENLAFIALSE